MLQMYFPLFSRTMDGSLASEFLDLENTKAKNQEFKQFQFCLKNDVRYSDDTLIETQDLRRTLTDLHQRQEILPKLKEIVIQSKCVHVELSSADMRYFDKFSGISSTILSSRKAPGGFPIGLGAYSLDFASPEIIRLKAVKSKVHGSFKAIEFTKFESVDSDFKKGIIDFNHVGQLEIPEFIKSTNQRVFRPVFKTYAVVVNYSNPEKRVQFSRCLNQYREDLRILTKMQLSETPGFLPTGLPGSTVTYFKNESKPLDCEIVSGGEPIRFLNYRSDTLVGATKLFNSINGKLPIKVKVVEINADHLVRMVFSENNLAAIIGFDSSTSLSSAASEVSTFFESFSRPSRGERVISEPLSGLDAAVRKSLQEPNAVEKNRLYGVAHKMLLDSGYVLPLGQVDTAQYYLKDIQNITWADRIGGYPRIDLMEIN